MPTDITSVIKNLEEDIVQIKNRVKELNYKLQEENDSLVYTNAKLHLLKRLNNEIEVCTQNYGVEYIAKLINSSLNQELLSEIDRLKFQIRESFRQPGDLNED